MSAIHLTTVRKWPSVAITCSVLVLSLLHQVIPSSLIQVHNFLQHLYFLPLMVAGLTFGWRGALGFSLLAGVAQAHHVASMWSIEPVYAVDQVLEWPVFCLAGVVAGLLAQQERQHRTRLEATKVQLEDVYQELQNNVERLRRSERLSAAGQLAAGLAHEIRNPLASITGAAGILKRGHASAENSLECLEIIEKETQRLNRLLSSFLEFARPRPPKLQSVDIRSLIDAVLALAQHRHEARTAQLIADTPPILPEIEADPEQLKQVLLNLLINAIQASPPDAVVRVTASADTSQISISVIDEGRGIPPAELGRVFEPFFTTKDEGTGLGLAIAATIVEQHNGLLSVEPNNGPGMCFRVTLPIRKPVAA